MIGGDIMNKDNKPKEPCAGCPYKLGLIQTFVSPCPGCAANGYKMIKTLLMLSTKFDRNKQ